MGEGQDYTKKGIPQEGGEVIHKCKGLVSEYLDSAPGSMNKDVALGNLEKCLIEVLTPKPEEGESFKATFSEEFWDQFGKGGMIFMEPNKTYLEESERGEFQMVKENGEWHAYVGKEDFVGTPWGTCLKLFYSGLPERILASSILAENIRTVKPAVFEKKGDYWFFNKKGNVEYTGEEN